MSEEAAPAAEETAPPATPLSMEERVAYLEAQNEGLKRVGLLGLVLVLMLGAILVHQTYSDLRSSTTRSVTLLNDQDQLSGAITVDAQGRTQFLQARYGSMAGASALPDGFRGYAFYDSDGVPRVLIGETNEKHTVFQVMDPVRGVAFDPFEDVKSAPPAGKPAPDKAPAPQGSPTAKPTP